LNSVKTGITDKCIIFAVRVARIGRVFCVSFHPPAQPSCACEITAEALLLAAHHGCPPLKCDAPTLMLSRPCIATARRTAQQFFTPANSAVMQIARAVLLEVCFAPLARQLQGASASHVFSPSRSLPRG